MFEWGRYGIQYVYACPECAAVVAPAVTGARSIIDWSLPAERIGDRAKPLAPKTMARIAAGLTRLQTLEPVQVQVGGNLFERRPGVRIWSIDDPLRTVVCTQQLALVVRYGGQGASPRVLSEPMQTITSHDRQIGLVVQNMENNVGRSVDEPTPPVTSGGNHMLVQVNRSSKGKAVDRLADPLDIPTRTIAGHGELGIVTLRNHADEAQSARLPVPTVTGGGYHHGLIVYNGNPGHVRELEEGLGTVKGRDSQSLLVPQVRGSVARSVGEPVGTLTSKQHEALVLSEADLDDCRFRMLQWHELLRAQAPFDHTDGRPYMLDARKRNARGRFVDLANEDRVKMIGNMVSSPVATMLGHALVFDTLAVA